MAGAHLSNLDVQCALLFQNQLEQPYPQGAGPQEADK